MAPPPRELGRLCFVELPFGRRWSSGVSIDFDRVWTELIEPAVIAAGLEPVRLGASGADVHIEQVAERLVICPYAIIDLSAGAPSALYALGMRHALRAAATVVVIAEGGRLPLELSSRPLGYRIELGVPSHIDDDRAAITRALLEARDNEQPASPLLQILDGSMSPDIQRLKTDVFRDRVQYSEDAKQRLAEARKRGREEVIRVGSQVLAELGGAQKADAAVVIDVLLSYRAVSAHDRMIELAGEMPRELAETVLVQEQYAFALNRTGARARAEQVLTALIESRGPSSETCGLLGRVYKDQWQDGGGDASLQRAIEAYLAGFEADPRDAYPGINAVTLMELATPPDPRRLELLPLVRYAVKRRIEDAKVDYWDHATLLELAVLAGDREAAAKSLENALALVRENWEPKTTAGNLALLTEARRKRGDGVEWLEEILAALSERAQCDER